MLIPALVIILGLYLYYGNVYYDFKANRILNKTGIDGGLVVHVGATDGKLTTALHANDQYRVHGIARSMESVKESRNYIREQGLYGEVSIAQWHGKKLPYSDNLVNLLVIDGAGKISNAEIMRVLSPDGKAWLKKEGETIIREKSWPETIDEWTHYLHGTDNNAVAQDSEVAPPRSLQWKSEPMWCRGHEYNSSIAAKVSAGGRIFYIVDRGIRGIHDPRFPEQWYLVARNAFNGVKLWERPMKKWGPKVWENVGFRSNPQVLPRRLVAKGDKVYVTLSYHGPLTILDAATGKTLEKCEDTQKTHEIVVSDKIAVLRVRGRQSDDTSKQAWTEVPEKIVALDRNNGSVLWKKEADILLPLSLSVKSGRVIYHNHKEIVCRALKNGKMLWRSSSRAASQPRAPSEGRWHRSNLETLIIYNEAVFFAAQSGLQAYSLETGSHLWTGPNIHAIAPTQPPGLFGINGLIWPTGAPNTMGKTSVNLKGFDPETGVIKERVNVDHLISPGHHFRCYRSKATQRYILLPKRGVEFTDLEGDNHMRHDWLRAPCSYGVLPANGMLYMPPHQCFCYPGVRFSGFNALSSDRQYGENENNSRGDIKRGPAWNTKPSPNKKGAHNWPTYRHDARRSGSINDTLPSRLKIKWKKELGGTLHQPVSANNKLFVVQEDKHTVWSLNAEKGEKIWKFTAGGRIDSPPTLYEGKVMFGCTNGWVYCLRQDDGEIIWRLQAAPAEHWITAYQQIESAWPVHGSVLVQNGIAYFTAGRSTHLDKGIYIYGVKPETGEILYQNHLVTPRPDVSKDSGDPFKMKGASSDILVSDGNDLYMYQMRFGPDLSRKKAPLITKLGDREMGLHLMSTKGFLDNTWFNRTYWTYSRRWPGYYFAYNGPKSGQMLVFDEDHTYGVHVFRKRDTWSPSFEPGKMDYELFADLNSTEPELREDSVSIEERPELKELPGRLRGSAIGVEKGPGYSRPRPPKWSKLIPARINAMVLGKKKLYAAGPPNIIPDDNPLAAFNGEEGSRLIVVSSEKGEKLADYQLDGLPVFDGMMAANNKIYMAMQDGSVICLSKKE